MKRKYNIGDIVKAYKIIGYDSDSLKYKCECIRCGNIVSLPTCSLKKNKGYGCKKCFTDGFIHTELIGKKFGCYTVIAVGERDKYRNERSYVCRCDCGNESTLTKSKITQREHKCCIKCRPKYLEKNNGSYIHGESKSQLYHTWEGIISRCYKKYNKRYDCYGERGITVCDEWLGEDGYINFRNWSYANGYVDEKGKNGRNKLSIDRIDTNGNYEPNNCRWVDYIVQANNKNTNRLVEYNGEIHTWAEWSRILNVPYHRIQSRITKGMSFENAIKDCNYHNGTRRLKDYV